MVRKVFLPCLVSPVLSPVLSLPFSLLVLSPRRWNLSTGGSGGRRKSSLRPRLPHHLPLHLVGVGGERLITRSLLVPL